MNIFTHLSNYFVFHTVKSKNTIIIIQTNNKILTYQFHLPFLNFFINIPFHK